MMLFQLWYKKLKGNYSFCGDRYVPERNHGRSCLGATDMDVIDSGSSTGSSEEPQLSDSWESATISESFTREDQDSTCEYPL